MDHDNDYPPGYLEGILREVRTVAMVGASSNPARPSHGVLAYMIDAGYDMIPVNPNETPGKVLGLTAHPDLASIGRPVDMVQVFRDKSALYGIAQEAITIGAKVLWAQVGVVDPAAARLAEEAGLRVVMNRCTRTILRGMGGGG